MLVGGVVLWFPSFPIAEVNLSLSCPERTVSDQILILQSQANLTWSLSVNNCHIQFLVGLSRMGVCVSHPRQGGWWHGGGGGGGRRASVDIGHREVAAPLLQALLMVTNPETIPTLSILSCPHPHSAPPPRPHSVLPHHRSPGTTRLCTSPHR